MGVEGGPFAGVTGAVCIAEVGCPVGSFAFVSLRFEAIAGEMLAEDALAGEVLAEDVLDGDGFTATFFVGQGLDVDAMDGVGLACELVFLAAADVDRSEGGTPKGPDGGVAAAGLVDG